MAYLSLGRIVLLLTVFSFTAAAEAEESIRDNRLAPGQTYHHLTVIMSLVEGADHEFVSLISGMQLIEADLGSDGGVSITSNLEVTANPTAQIADPDGFLRTTAHLISFGLNSREAIEADLRQLEEQHGRIVDTIDTIQLIEEAMLMRMSVLETARRRLGDLTVFQNYESHTVQFRNNMETAAFQSQLGQLTEDYIAQVEGAHDMVIRLLQSEVDPYAIPDAIARAARMDVESRAEIAFEHAVRLRDMLELLGPGRRYQGNY